VTPASTSANKHVLGAEDALPGEARVLAAAERALAGERRGMRVALPFLGPAFIAAVAYIDPGNFATNMAGGSKFGYTLLWVVLAANLMAMLIQSMSAKLGIATGRNLPEVCRDRFPRPVVFGLWLQAEAIAMATDLAEFVGAALGLHLVFGLPLFASGLITAVLAFAILGLQARGFRRFEVAIALLVGVIVSAFAAQVLRAHPSSGGIAHGLAIPQFKGSESVLLAVGILGATVMPHVIYLHSALTQRRIVGATETDRKKIFRFELLDVILAMGIAGVVNIAMLTIAAAVFHTRGLLEIGGHLDQVYHGLDRYLGGHSGLLFGVALLASGLSSSCVGTLAGQVVMQGFIHRQIPIFVRRAITMAPALVLLGIGYSPTRGLVLSQVFLSFGIPFALIPLVMFCRNPSLMGNLVNRRLTSWTAYVVTSVIVGLNFFLLYQTLL
jgi:manganese transport protein